MIPATINTGSGRQVLIREAETSDAENILKFARKLFTDTDQVLTLASEFTINQEQEETFIKAHLDSPSSLLLVAVCENNVIGFLNFACAPKIKMKHTGEFGVSVDAAYRGEGIGRALITCLLDWAENVPQVEKIFLNVFDTNIKAIGLYSSLGFAEEGRQKKAIRQQNGSYADMITMAKFFER